MFYSTSENGMQIPPRHKRIVDDGEKGYVSLKLQEGEAAFGAT
jgi:hypothetical protein